MITPLPMLVIRWLGQACFLLTLTLARQPRFTEFPPSH